MVVIIKHLPFDFTRISSILKKWFFIVLDNNEEKLLIIAALTKNKISNSG